MMTLSVVSHRQGDLVASLLDDLARLASPQVSAIVVTRNVDEPAIVVPPSLASIVEVVDNAVPKGFGANHNAAFGRCATPLFAVVNPDIRLPDDPFAALCEDFSTGATGPDVGLVAPRITAPDGTDEDAARKLITPWALLRHRVLMRARSAEDEFDWLAGMFMVVRRDAFEALGGFDSRYFMYCEDFDLCARLRLAGWRLVRDERVRVVHAARRASRRSPRHLYWHVASLLRMWASPVFWRFRRVVGRPAA